MHRATISKVVYETDDITLIDAARRCGPGFAAKIAAKEGKIWRVVAKTI